VEESTHFIASNADPNANAWDGAACAALIVDLQALRKSLVAAEAQRAAAGPPPSASARNLTHYLALRRHDLRALQDRLAGLGLSSLGRAETHVLANVDKVLGVLHALCGRAWSPRSTEEPAGYRSGQALQRQHAEALFGPAPARRKAHIMVTLPSEAATDAALVRELVQSGMDVARINCAHDEAGAWIAMAAHVREAAAAAGRPVRVLMDLGGPKIRTGPIAPGPQVLKLKPARDAFGVVTAPARLLLRPRGGVAPDASAGATLEVDADWLAQLREDDVIHLVDARSRKRQLRVVQALADGVRVQCERTAYLCPQTRLAIHRPSLAVPATGLPDIAAAEGRLLLSRGQTLRLTQDGLGQSAATPAAGRRKTPATLACTLPQVLKQLRAGERIWFDDGRIGGVIRRVAARWVDVEITDAADGGEKLAADKGINLPDSHLELPALTDKDIVDLRTVARHADMVGLSFAQSAADVQALRAQLGALCANHLGVVLKIETRRAFEHLPEMLFAAMACPAAGVMIARGDLAVECGFERLAEVQEEILWACEAAHMPVVWATQVLENLAKTGRPSRAEISDAAMGVRADCVMLNKGPHILQAMHSLDDILRRMQEHQSKKRPLLRALKSWAPPRSREV
jgi:pyruvate kinase